ncbi:tRNA pseudouridine(13) synthase TruD [Myxococcota bacterium]|nr:tRNA pseudouridine(13) synthase TruD [Myxococcota bacterium]
MNTLIDSTPWHILPRLHADLEEVGGITRQRCEDFIVQEIPVYLPQGEGDHLFILIEKKGVNSEDVRKQLARYTGIKPRDIGVAGLKDKIAITTQYMSIPLSAARDIEKFKEKFKMEGVKIIECTPHNNKLKTGHLIGNRFILTIRDAPEGALERAQKIAEAISQKGVPNFYGHQRFGQNGGTAKMGLRLLEENKAQTKVRQPPPHLKRLALSAIQSFVYNEFVRQRLSDGLFFTVLLGDIMQVVESGGPFYVDDVEREQPRLDAKEIVQAGPMPGPKMKEATGPARQREDDLLARLGLTYDDFRGFGKIMRGTRRPISVMPENILIEESDGVLTLQFTLPKGSYASVVLNEFGIHDASNRRAAP